MASLDHMRWRNLCGRVGLGEEEDTFSRLQSKYEQRHRKYHNARHINDCLAYLDASRHSEMDNPLVEYALWFHDAIFNTFSSKNEERSAEWAAMTLRRGSAGPEACKFVRSLIMATRHGEVPTEPPHRLIVDIDLCILGVPSDRFAEFEDKIRQEYWWVPGKAYRRKRMAVLRSFLDRPSIYSTKEFRERFEEQARANLRRSVEELGR